jgi:carboxylesterase type B
MSGLNCLNLNITVPHDVQKEAIPVMVFIHGGGFIMGANWWPQYEPTRLVQMSMENEMPVIAVNIKYVDSILQGTYK